MLEGISIFQNYDITCAIVLEEEKWRVYIGGVILKEDKKKLSAAGWKKIDMFVWEYVGRPS